MACPFSYFGETAACHFGRLNHFAIPRNAAQIGDAELLHAAM
jgi:hypothetical protein